MGLALSKEDIGATIDEKLSAESNAEEERNFDSAEDDADEEEFQRQTSGAHSPLVTSLADMENGTLSPTVDNDEERFRATPTITTYSPPAPQPHATTSEATKQEIQSGTRRRPQNDDDDDDDKDKHTETTPAVATATDAIDELYMLENTGDESMADEQAASLAHIMESLSLNAGEDELDAYTRFANNVADNNAEDMALEFSQSHEKDIYFVRRFRYPSSMFVVARGTTPLIAYLWHIAALEQVFRRQVDTFNQMSLPIDASQADMDVFVPGILARVATDVLQEPAQFIVPVDDGTRTRLFPTQDGDPATARRDGIELPLSTAPLLVIEPIDRDYNARMEAARRMQASPPSNGANALRDIDNRLKAGHLRQFTVTGDRVPFGERPSPGWESASPVLDETDVWWVVNLHYYLAWRAFEQTCEGNGNFMSMLNVKLHTLPETSYFFPIKMDREKMYNVRQEHEVLQRVLEEYRRTLKEEAEIDALHLQLRNLMEVTLGALDAETMRIILASLGGSNTWMKAADALSNLNTAFNTLQKVQTRLAELDAARSRRSYTVQ